MDEHGTAVARVAAVIARIQSIPMILALAGEISGRNVTLLARLTDEVWTACAVHYHLGRSADAESALPSGCQVQVDFGPTNQPIVIARLKDSKDQAFDAADTRECSIASPIVLANGRCFGLLCTLDSTAPDIADPQVVSKLKLLSALIAQQLDQVEARDRDRAEFLDERAAGQLREQFIAMLGHDLRDPLHAISMCSDLLTRHLTHPQAPAIATRIKANARRMSLLINEVLDFARARLGGGIEIGVTDAKDINAGLATIVQELRDAQPECKIISSINVRRSVRCDMGKMQQVASNLLSNALAHGLPHGSIKITAHADENDLILEVWNAGEPIPPESIGKIFEPFWRHSTSASRNGLGLGLHICSHIIRAHKGSLSVTSTREAGTQFTARLPLTPSPPAQFALALAENA